MTPRAGFASLAFAGAERLDGGTYAPWGSTASLGAPSAPAVEPFGEGIGLGGAFLSTTL